MRIDLNTYKVNKKFIQDKYLEQPDCDIGTLISTLACGTMCPCIVVAYWIGEISGWHQDAVDAIKRLTKFYGYKEIVNKPDGSPC